MGEMVHKRWMAVALALGTMGCEVLGGGGSPPPIEGGTRGLAAESTRPLELVMGQAGEVRHVRMQVPVVGDVGAAAQSFVAGHLVLFGMDQGDFTVEVADTRERDGITAVRLVTRYQGVPVEAGDVVVSVIDGAIRSASSAHAGPFTVDVAPAMDADAALAVLETAFGEAPEAGPAELVIVDVGAMGADESTGPELAWRFLVTAPFPETSHVSATEGRLILRAASLRNGLARTVRDADGDAYTSRTTRWAVLGEESTPPPAAMPDAERAFVHLGEAYDSFWDRYSFQSYDGACAPLVAAVNYPVSVLGPNAFWSGNDNAFYFTPGMVAADLTYHEYTHAVLDYAGFSRLEYIGRSGAVEEGLADGFAAFLSEPGADRWLLGEALVDQAPTSLPRDMAEPTLDGRQVDHLDDYRVAAAGGTCVTASDCPDEHACQAGQCICRSRGCDFGGVHSNSGILAHVLYLASEGGRHGTRGGATLTGIGVAKLEQITWAALLFLSPHSGFRALREDMVTACQVFADGGVSPNGAGVITHEDCGRVINAFAAAGIGPEDGDLDSYSDRTDNCPTVPNPTQDPADACIADPFLQCAAFRYERAFELFLEGADLFDATRNRGDASIITARCAISNQDYSAALDFARAAVGSSRSGGLADANFIAEFAAEKRGRVRQAEAFGLAGIEAARSAGACSGLVGDELDGCASQVRTNTRSGLERL